MTRLNLLVFLNKVPATFPRLLLSILHAETLLEKQCSDEATFLYSHGLGCLHNGLNCSRDSNIQLGVDRLPRVFGRYWIECR